MLFLVCMLQVFNSQPSEDITVLPDYPYKKTTMYSGYLDIKGSPGKKLHYLYVDSQRNKEKDPLVLWLNGGPGCSSLLGFGDENGPAYFIPNSQKFIENEWSWNKQANMLYLEAPAGVGFSIAEKPSDRETGDNLTAENSLQALISFFKKFPNLNGREFYISGESYAGIYIPTLADKIIDYNASATEATKINLKGILVGNGVTDLAQDDFSFIDFAYEHGLYSYEVRQRFVKHCGTVRPYPISTKPLCAEAWASAELQMGKFFHYDIYRFCPDTPYSAKKDEFSHLNFIYNKQRERQFGVTLNRNPVLSFLEDTESVEPNYYNGCDDGGDASGYYNRPDVKKALHVKESITWKDCSNLSYDQSKKGSIWVYPKLFKNQIKVWIYSGDTDGVVPYNGSRDWIINLNLQVVKPERVWNIDNDRAAGIIIEYSNLTFVTVHGTGHMVPQWKRREAFHMFNSFINGSPL